MELQKFIISKIKSFTILSLFLTLFSSISLNAQSLDSVKAGKFDTGKMWTFEDAPVEYFNETYGFKPTEEWLEKVRMSALKFAQWCSASFVSEDGLIMTNHHCVDFITARIEEEGENLVKNGFYAETLADERKVPGVFVDQLVLIEDVTDQVVEAINNVPDAEKNKVKEKTINELQDYYSEETSLICKVVELYNGGKYSLYGYKRYNDIRMVYVNERSVGLYGGDPDNFTFPRYNADFAFLRAYDEDGTPLKTDNFFKWSPNGAQPGEPIFVVGNPGSTERLKTVSQLEYERDFRYRNGSFMMNGLVSALNQEMKEFPEKTDELEGMTFFIANTAKVFQGVLKGLNDPYFMAKKRAFESEFKKSVNSNPELAKKYGHLWDAISDVQTELRRHAGEVSAYTINGRTSSAYFLIAQDLIKYAEQLKLPEEKRDVIYKGEELIKKTESLFPKKFESSLEEKKLALQADLIGMNLGTDNPLYLKLFGQNKNIDAAKFALSKSSITNSEDLQALVAKGADAILESDDPFISYILNTKTDLEKFKTERSEIRETEEVLTNALGRALFEVYGTSIPPDATFTLRINDGVLKGYEYNGTEAPTHTTFYGMYDRYYSHNKQKPWDLPERWVNPSSEFDLSTTYNFVSTNDIVGGSSGSPVINKNGEIVGLAFDGNMESLPGKFLYSDEKNRMVSVASQGIYELLENLLEAKRISSELKAGKILPEYK